MQKGQAGLNHMVEPGNEIAQQKVTLKTFMDQHNPPGAQYMYLAPSLPALGGGVLHD